MKPAFGPVLLALLLFAAAASALTLDQTLKFYIKAGEVTKTEDMKVDGETYHLLKVNGEPYVVLSKTDEGYAAVTDDKILDSVLEAYVKQAFEQKSWNQSLLVLNESKGVVEAVVGECVIGVNTFLENIPRRVIRIGNANLGLYFLISRSRNGTYKTEYDAIDSLNKSGAPFEAAYKQFIEKSGSLEEALKNKNVFGSLDAISVLRDSSTQLKKEYTSVTSAYASLGASKDFNQVLLYTFYQEGKKHVCSFNANVTTALTKIENEFSDKSLKPVSEVKKTLLLQTKEREQTAASQTAHAIREERMLALASRIANTTTLYSGASKQFSFTDLNKKKGEVEAALKKIKENASVSEFDSLEKKIDEDLKKYKDFAPEFKNAAKAVAEAKANFSAAVKRYGEADERVAELKKKVDQLENGMTQNTLSLQNGDFAKASFANATTTAKELARAAGAIRPKEAEIDPVIIGAVVVLILGLGGTVYYFRRMKKPEGL